MGDDSRPTPTRTFTSLAVSAACGLMFGFAIEKGKVYEPAVVKNQMLLSQFVMMKMFLSGIISGMFVLAVMSMLPFTRRQYLGAKSVFVRGLREKGFLTTLSGGALLGSGMAIAGSVGIHLLLSRSNSCTAWIRNTEFNVHITGSIIRDPALWDPRTSRHRPDQTSTNDTIPIFVQCVWISLLCDGLAVCCSSFLSCVHFGVSLSLGRRNQYYRLCLPI